MIVSNNINLTHDGPLALAALENMLRQYRGSLLVASHDQVFLQRIAIDAELRLDAHYRA